MVLLSLVYMYHSADANTVSTASTIDNGNSDGSSSGQGVCNREVLISYGFSGVNKPTNRPH